MREGKVPDIPVLFSYENGASFLNLDHAATWVSQLLDVNDPNASTDVFRSAPIAVISLPRTLDTYTERVVTALIWVPAAVARSQTTQLTM